MTRKPVRTVEKKGVCLLELRDCKSGGKTFSKCDEHPRPNCSRKCVNLCENLCHYCYLLLINLKKCLGALAHAAYIELSSLQIMSYRSAMHAILLSNSEFFISIVQILCKYAAYPESCFWNECMGYILQFSLCVLILCVCVLLIM